MGVVIIDIPHRRRVLVQCCTYQDAVDWAEAHDYRYIDSNGIEYPLIVEDRCYG